MASIIEALRNRLLSNISASNAQKAEKPPGDKQVLDWFKLSKRTADEIMEKINQNLKLREPDRPDELDQKVIMAILQGMIMFITVKDAQLETSQKEKIARAAVSATLDSAREIASPLEDSGRRDLYITAARDLALAIIDCHLSPKNQTWQARTKLPPLFHNLRLARNGE
jgi:hypothetical protein